MASAGFTGFQGRIAFVYANEEDAYETICAANPDGSSRTCPGGSGDLRLYQPAYSPDGSQIAYANLPADSSNELWLMNADGTGKHTLGEGTGPAWSPDGARIAFEVGDGISLMDADGTNIEPLVPAGGSPAWSPDGTLIAYSTTANVYVVPSVGSATPTLLIENGRDPDWSPDGTKIAFMRYDDSGDDWDIWVADADGGNESLLTNNDVFDGDPAWSPDGTKIAFTADHPPNGYVGIAVMNASDGTGRAFITPASADYYGPTWQPLIIRLQAAGQIVQYGRSVALSAQLFWADTTDNDILSLFQTPLGSTSSLVDEVTVDSEGRASFLVTPTRRTTYSAQWAGAGMHGPAVTRIVIAVRVITTSRLLRFYATSGKYKLYHAGSAVFQRGRVVPNHAGKLLTFRAQRLSGGRWVSAGSGRFRIGANGTVTAVFRAPPGTFRAQTIFPRDTDHLGDSSPWNYFKIR